MTVRPPVVAGRFYPREPRELTALIERQLAPVDVPPDEPLAAAYVVPHAGYRFSGPVAAHVYARLRAHVAEVGHVVILGPSHRVPLRGCATTPAREWRTPLGGVLVEPAEGVHADSVPHEQEHSIEVQVPFLQTVCPDARITPVAVGVAGTENVADVIDALVEPGTLLLCSTDLSHYHPLERARDIDRRTADAILGRDHAAIGVKDACGVFALRGTLAWAERHGHGVRELDLRTSADTYGGPDRVVGYPAFAIGSVS